MSPTQCVEERLPPRAAAGADQPQPHFTDIYLPIDAEEKALFDEIDDRRSIGEIVGLTRFGPWRDRCSSDCGNMTR